jgi:dTDP-4-amino-4,6-dideoxygalactose transaminase
VIAFTGFADEPAPLRDAMKAAAADVVDSHHYVLGSAVQRFERRFADAAGVAHVIGVANGMDGLEICLRALGIGPGDEVVTTPMTAFATPLAILRAGATPVFADIDPATALLSRASVERCLTERTRAVILVHLYGQARDLAGWADWSAARGLDVIEDCAQSHLAVEGGRAAGTVGRANATSFYPTKNLGALGDAGAVLTGDASLADLARMLRNYGQANRYEHPVAGLNSRLDEMQAAILDVRLDWLDAFTERRRDVAERYEGGIDNPAITLLAPPTERSAHARHLFVVRADDRDALADHLGAAGVPTLIHYPIPAHEQPPCRDAARDPEGLSHAEQHARTCLSIPCHPQLSDDDVDTVIRAVNAFRG